MNMRLPRYLRDSDPALSNVPINETPVEIADVEYDWMVEELENVERQVEQALWEEAFIEACFEEMLAEEEAQWHHFTYLTTPNLESPTVPTGGPCVPQFTPLLSTVPCWMPCSGSPVDPHTQQMADQSKTDCWYSQPIDCSRLNPEAPEFVPRGFSS